MKRKFKSLLKDRRVLQAHISLTVDWDMETRYAKLV